MGIHFGTVEKIRQVRSLGQSLVARCWSLVFRILRVLNFPSN